MAEDKKQKRDKIKPSKSRTPKSAGAGLREEAEKRLRLAAVLTDNLSAIDLKKLVHELQVHQIELEMQNEELRKTQEDLEESRGRYADLYDFAPIGYLTINSKGTIIESNLTAANQLGTERSQLINKPFVRFIHKDDQDLFYIHRNAVLENRTLQACELRLLRKDRSLFYARLECLAVQNEDEGVSSIRMAVVDVTKRVQAENELKYSEAKYRELIETSIVGIFRTNLSGEFLFANKALSDMFEYDPPGNIMTVNASSLYKHPEQRSDFIRMLKDKGSVENYELDAVTATGRSRYVVFNATLRGDEITGMVLDITDRRQAEEKVKLKQHLNEVLLDSLPHPAMLIRRDRIILAANRIAREVGAKVGGYCWQEFGHGEYISDDDKKYIAEHKKIPVRGTMCYFCKSDEAMQSQASVSAEVNSFNRLWDTYWVPLDEEIYLHYALDITDQKHTEEKLKVLLSQLEKSNRELSDFAYIVSHDLKEPLRALNSLAKWIVDDYADKFDEAGREKIGLLISRVRRMNDLVEGILRYSRAGRIIQEASPQDLNRTVSEVISMLNPPPHISVSIAGTLPVIAYERSSMQQVFQNLIENAVKYMDKPEGSIKISAGKDGNFWNICVSDNGPGIDEKDYEKIFQMFGVLQPRDKVEASGVGLAVVKKIIEMYGGKVWVESEVGKGSSFYFAIPK